MAPTGHTRRITTGDGLTLAVHGWDGSGAGAQAHPVLLHHGFSSSTSVEWPRSGVLDALLATGRRVVAVDARGHGASDKPHDAARYGEARMAADVIDVLDALDLAQVDLVGYSMGSVVSLLVASTHPDRVHRLAVGGVGAGIVEVGGVDTRALSSARLAEALRSPDPATITDPMVRGFREFAEQTGNDLPALAAQADAVHASPSRWTGSPRPRSWWPATPTPSRSARRSSSPPSREPGSSWSGVTTAQPSPTPGSPLRSPGS